MSGYGRTRKHKRIADSSQVSYSALRCANDLVTICSISIQHSVDKSCSWTFKSNSISADVWGGEESLVLNQEDERNCFPQVLEGAKALVLSFGCTTGPLLSLLALLSPLWMVMLDLSDGSQTQWKSSNQDRQINILVMVVLG